MRVNLRFKGSIRDFKIVLYIVAILSLKMTNRKVEFNPRKMHPRKMTIMIMKSVELVKNKIFRELFIIVVMQLRKRRIKNYHQTINNLPKVKIMLNGKIIINNRCRLLHHKDLKISNSIQSNQHKMIINLDKKCNIILINNQNKPISAAKLIRIASLSIFR